MTSWHAVGWSPVVHKRTNATRWQMCARAHICQNDMGVNQLLASLV